MPTLGSDDAKAQFKAGEMRILECALARRHPLVVVRNSFWADPTNDQVLNQVYQEADVIFVNAGPLGREGAIASRVERSLPDDGVASHRGDHGMKALADANVQAVVQLNAALR